MNIQGDEIGFLTVDVKTANGALPVENAQVTIYNSARDTEKDPSSLSSDVIYNLTTDRSGKTQKVALKTKSAQLSQSPDEKIPFMSYNISVNADGFYDNSYLNVPIFQGITSIQEVLLIPLSEFASPTDPIPNSQRQYLESIN
ncbi:MAG: hypothetical protein J6C61_08460 [Clostridia bacterium]|nr:hypothetical protein [Clostridia bacterium]